MNNIMRVTFRCKNIINYTECKRFAGHSKWANIKHTKMEKDAQKALAIRGLLQKMRAAIAEGKSAKPDENVKLARLLDQAKKQSMPMTTIKNFLDKMQASKGKTSSAIVESRGPSGCVVLIHILSDNIGLTKNNINTHLRKSQFSPNDYPTPGLFEEKGVILTSVNDISLDQATEDAIDAGAEDAEKLKENDQEFFQFLCHASDVYKVRNKLEEKNYKILQADVEYVPKVLVTLKDEEMEMLNKLYDRLNAMEEVYKIYNNVS